MTYRISPSVHLFGAKIEKAWGIKEWQGWKDPDKEILFFGLYEIEDYNVYHNCEGKKTIFWCGGDIPRIFQNPERMRIAKENPETEHWVETIAQAEELKLAGIKTHIAPSFLEDINDFPVLFKPTNKPHIYLSGHPSREEEYGFYQAYQMAKKFPDVTFHLYGVEKLPNRADCPLLPNVICHGWVSNKQFNEEIKHYQGSIRANTHDGASEIAFKSMLMGQYAITYLPYKYAWQYRTEEELAELIQRLIETKKPNFEGREYWKNNLNKFPWIPVQNTAKR